MKTRFSPSVYPNVTFWLCFFILNALLFLPLYWLNRDSSSFLPLGNPLRDGFASFFNGLLVWRDNFDPFRLNVEAPILVALWVHVGWLRGRVYRILFAIIYLIALIYYIYEGVALSMFAVEPVFYGQYEWFVDGATFLLEHMQLPIYLYIAAISGLIAAVLAIWALISAMLGGVPVEKLSRWSRMSVAIIALVALGCTIWFRAALANPMMAVSSLSYKLEKNVEESLRLYKDVSSFDDTLMREAYDYRGMDMAKKPNLYLIFIESYGSVLYKRPDYLQQYTALTTELDATLKEHGLHVKSTLSTAPTWGGGSWMSYTSAFMGMRINEHPEYLTLFDKYQTQTYPDLGYYLKSQGYQYYRLAALSTELKESAWQKYMNFYKADEWIRYPDLAYTGPGYGWGPAPPDQYTINKAHELITQKTDGPFALFYITQNSHYPWIPHPTLVDDWHTLNQVPDTNDKTDPEAITHEMRRQNYFNAVEYQLRFMTDYIINLDDDNAIFMLLGDHQPPRVSRRSDGWETPLHIISKDQRFIDSLAAYGFVDGLRVQSMEPTLRHEGFYSMFTRALLMNYGKDPTNLPEYRPTGFLFASGALAKER
ncbi:MAG: sulfatase-like hydrolase/transferase [Caldilineaceae bacterium]